MKLDKEINMAVVELKKLMAKHEITPTSVAINIKMVPTRMFEILSQRRRVTADSDLRLCKLFKLKPGHFLKLQLDYDLEKAEEKLGNILKEIPAIEQILHKF